MGKVLLTMLALFVASPASAQFLSGNKLLGYCQGKPGSADFSTCLGFVAGVSDSIGLYQDVLLAERVVCVPKTQLGQVREVVVQYLINTPQKRHEDAAFLSYLAMVAAFPCKR